MLVKVEANSYSLLSVVGYSLGKACPACPVKYKKIYADEIVIQLNAELILQGQSPFHGVEITKVDEGTQNLALST